MSTVWTDEQVIALRNDWALGLTTSHIGSRLGFSKNAVVGKVHRLDLESRPSPLRPKRELAPRPVQFVLPGLPSLAKPAWNAKPAPSQAMHDRVVRLLSDGSANVSVAADTGLTMDQVRKIRKTLVIAKRVVEPRVTPSHDIEFVSRSRPHHAGYGYQASGFGDRFQFGKQVERRKNPGTFPSSEDIAAHIAARGVTMCPTAAAANTSASIAAQDRIVLAEYRAARNAEFDELYAARNKRATAGSVRAAAMRR